jgi:hypothetical protein
MKTLCPIAMLILLLAVVPAVGGAAEDPLRITGGDLLKTCTSGMRGLDGQAEDCPTMAAAASCGNYLAGCVDAYMVWGHKDVCVPQGLTGPALMRAVAPWLRAHPATWTMRRRDALYAALREVYPCPAPALSPCHPPPGQDVSEGGHARIAVRVRQEDLETRGRDVYSRVLAQQLHANVSA